MITIHTTAEKKETKTLTKKEKDALRIFKRLKRFTDATRPKLSGVYIHSGFAVSSNGHVMTRHPIADLETELRQLGATDLEFDGFKEIAASAFGWQRNDTLIATDAAKELKASIAYKSLSGCEKVIKVFDGNYCLKKFNSLLVGMKGPIELSTPTEFDQALLLKNNGFEYILMQIRFKEEDKTKIVATIKSKQQEIREKNTAVAA